MKLLKLALSNNYPLTIEAKEAACIGDNQFPFPHEYSGVASRPSPKYECGMRNSLYPIRTTSFASILMHLMCTLMIL